MKYWTRKEAKPVARKACAELTTMLESIKEKYGMELGSDDGFTLSYMEKASMNRPFTGYISLQVEIEDDKLCLEEDLKKSRLRQAALDKLSKEEKEVLGL